MVLSLLALYAVTGLLCHDQTVLGYSASSTSSLLKSRSIATDTFEGLSLYRRSPMAQMTGQKDTGASNNKYDDEQRETWRLQKAVAKARKLGQDPNSVQLAPRREGNFKQGEHITKRIDRVYGHLVSQDPKQRQLELYHLGMKQLAKFPPAARERQDRDAMALSKWKQRVRKLGYSAADAKANVKMPSKGATPTDYNQALERWELHKRLDGYVQQVHEAQHQSQSSDHLGGHTTSLAEQEERPRQESSPPRQASENSQDLQQKISHHLSQSQHHAYMHADYVQQLLKLRQSRLSDASQPGQVQAGLESGGSGAVAHQNKQTRLDSSTFASPGPSGVKPLSQSGQGPSSHQNLGDKRHLPFAEGGPYVDLETDDWRSLKLSKGD